MSAKPHLECFDLSSPDRMLVYLLREVPTYYERVRTGLNRIDIYDDALAAIAKYGTDDQREWSDLAQYIRQEKAMLRADGRSLRGRA